MSGFIFRVTQSNLWFFVPQNPTDFLDYLLQFVRHSETSVFDEAKINLEHLKLKEFEGHQISTAINLIYR